MNIFRSYFILLSAALLLSGFSWGLGSDKCTDAIEIADSIEALRDETKLRQAEARILSLCPEGAAAHYVMGLQFERVGNVESAISEYRKAQNLKNPYPKASGNLGLLYAQKGMNDLASVELTRGVATPNASPRYHKALGLIFGEYKVFPLAIHHLSQATRELENDSEAFATLADMYVAAGQPDKAIEEYNRSLAIDGNNPRGHIGLASIYLKRNEQDKALAQLKKAEISNQQNSTIHMMMGAIYEKKGDKKQAEYEYVLGGKGKAVLGAKTVALTTKPAAEPAPFKGDLAREVEYLQDMLKDSPGTEAETYEKLGNLYRSAGKDEEAVNAYKSAAYRNSTSSDVYLNMGIIYEKQGKLDEAVVAYKHAIKIKPGPDASLRLADIYLARGSYSQAVEQYGEFLKYKPESPDIQIKLARILARDKENNLAIEAYNAVLRLSPNNIDANREIAPLYKTRGMNDKAAEHYKKVLEQQKDDMDTRNSLVSIYVKNKQYEEVTELLKGAAELFPDDPNNHYKLGLIYEFRKDYENAIAGYKKATTLKNDHARSLNALGRLYMKTGRISEAKEVLEAAKKADPTLEETTVLLNNIRDEFNPEPQKINKKLKGSRNKKSKKSKKAKKAPAKTNSAKPAAKKTSGT